MKHLMSVFMITISYTLCMGQESYLNQVVDRIYELQEMGEKKQQRINELSQDVIYVSRENKHLRREVDAQRRLIERKTADILLLQRDIVDLQHECDRLKDDLQALGRDNERLNNIIADLESTKQSLQRNLAQADSTVSHLSQALKEANRENEMLSAELRALEDRIDQILNNITSVVGFDLSYLAPYGPEGAITKGWLVWGNDLYIGGRVGYTVYKDPELTSTPIDLPVLPVCFELRKAITKRNLGFEFNGDAESTIDNPKMFMSFRMGYSFSLNPPQNSLFDRGGIRYGLSLGYTLNTRGSSQWYVTTGVDIQSVRSKEVDVVRHPGAFILSTGLIFGKPRDVNK